MVLYTLYIYLHLHFPKHKAFALSVKAHFYLKPISLSLFIATHCSSNKKMREDSVLCCALEFWVFLIICVSLVLFAGITSGLALGLLSFSQVELEVFTKAGRPRDQKYAGWHSIIFHYICAFSFNYAKKVLSMFVDSLFFFQLICSKDTATC